MGLNVGPTEGDTVGLEVGLGVVGAAVGDVVGLSVGLPVGLPVGADVHTSSTQNPAVSQSQHERRLHSDSLPALAHDMHCPSAHPHLGVASQVFLSSTAHAVNACAKHKGAALAITAKSSAK